jgi:hypothetical protein
VSVDGPLRYDAVVRLLFAGAFAVVVAACGNITNEECPVGFDDCNGDPVDGCEADLASVATCGTCEQTCTAPADGTPMCVGASTCDFDCGALIACGDTCVARCETVFDAPGESIYTVPARCTALRIQAWGAGGGNGRGNTSAGAGGFGIVELDAMPGAALTVVVAAPGGAAGAMPGTGGAPGGGDGGTASGQAGGGGGGFSGVFRGAVAVENAIVVAGGGGGSGGGGGNAVVAGAGGGDSGQAGLAAGGTQTTGFAPLAGGAGGSQGSGDGGGGGGGGWFGGIGGQGANSDGGGGGGGSGYAATDTTFQLLVAGNRALAGADTRPDRGTAGDPGMPGKVVVDCIP